MHFDENLIVICFRFMGQRINQYEMDFTCIPPLFNSLIDSNLLSHDSDSFDGWWFDGPSHLEFNNHKVLFFYTQKTHHITAAYTF